MGCTRTVTDSSVNITGSDGMMDAVPSWNRWFTLVYFVGIGLLELPQIVLSCPGF